MIEPENDFGHELAAAMVQFGRLMQLAGKCGISADQHRKHRELLGEIKSLCDAAVTLLDAPMVDQAAVDAMMEQIKYLTQAVLCAIRVPGVQ